MKNRWGSLARVPSRDSSEHGSKALPVDFFYLRTGGEEGSNLAVSAEI